jgi:hypothetical protein
MTICNITTASDADFYRGFSYQDINGNPIDLTGSTMHMGVRKDANDVAEVLLLTTDYGGGITITDPPNGLFTVWITQAQLMDLPPDTYVHSLIRNIGPLHLEMWSGTITHEVGPSR